MPGAWGQGGTHTHQQRVQMENASVVGVGLGLGEDVGGYSLASVWNEEGVQEAYQGPGFFCCPLGLVLPEYQPPS